MPSEQIQWFPGHMARTRRMIAENLRHVDLVLELLDARIPLSSRNPEIARLTAGKPTLVLLNKADLADPDQNRLWQRRCCGESTACLLTDCAGGDGIARLAPAIRELMADRLRRNAEKGVNRRLRAMVLGIPNVGKSTLINRICGNRKARAEDRPGVTRDKQWVSTGIGVDLLDMPGILWPKFEDRHVGENLALTGAIKDEILDTEALAVLLCGRLRRLYPGLLSARYRLQDIPPELDDNGLFLAIGRRRGFLAGGAEVDTERTARVLLDEFRAAKIGRITLDRPESGAPESEGQNAGTDA